jgi:hypothetical protein
MDDNRYIQSAQSLIQRLNAPPQAHSVYVQTSVNDQGEFVRKLCVSIHPNFKKQVIIPQTHEGFAVEQVPWPQSMV